MTPFKFNVFLPLLDITEEVFSPCGIQRKSFFPLLDTTEKVFFRCGIQQKRIFPVVGEQSQDGKQSFFYCIPQCRTFFFRCILHNNRILCSALYPRKIFRTVSHNAAGFPLLYPTMEDICLHCGIQRERIFLVVGYNGRRFPPLWDTTEEVFSILGNNGIGFFPLWDTMEKNYATPNDIFKCLSLPPNKNLGQYLLLEQSNQSVERIKNGK